jgi:hypothetical protein
MTDSSNPPPGQAGSGLGCLWGLAVAIGIPAVVFVGILIANTLDPQCGTPGDSGGCEMGLASGTITAVVIGLVLGIVVAIATSLAGRASRQAGPPRDPSE